MWALARDDPVILGVTFLSCPAPTKGARAFARPRFPGPAPYCQEPGQASFCPCTLRRSSDPPELAFGRPCYLFAGVPPQPNRPPDAVPRALSRGNAPGPRWAVFHWPLQWIRRPTITGSRLRYATGTRGKRRAAVKLHEVFSPYGGMPACAPAPWASRGPGLGQWGPR
jgi:hypothetical protein